MMISFLGYQTSNHTHLPVVTTAATLNPMKLCVASAEKALFSPKRIMEGLSIHDPPTTILGSSRLLMT